MNYGTKERAIEVAKEMNKERGYAPAYPVMDENGMFTVIRAYNIQRWLITRSGRKRLYPLFGGGTK